MLIQSPWKKGKRGGFTLIELLVSVSISVMILGALYMVFDRVQLVLRKGHGQSHVLERGRALMDMIVRDLELIAPSGVSPQDIGNFGKINLYSRSVNHNFVAAANKQANMTPDEQRLYDLQTEPLHAAELCAVSFDGGWKVFGYGLYSLDSTAALSDWVGSIWRYEESVADRSLVANSVQKCISGAKTKHQKVTGGIIHFRVRAFAQPIQSANPPISEPRATIENPLFTGIEVPTHVEVEFGLIEEKLVAELANVGEPFDAQIVIELDLAKRQLLQAQKFAAQREFLVNHLDRVHMFRQLVTIKNLLIQ